MLQNKQGEEPHLDGSCKKKKGLLLCLQDRFACTQTTENARTDKHGCLLFAWLFDWKHNAHGWSGPWRQRVLWRSPLPVYTAGKKVAVSQDYPLEPAFKRPAVSWPLALHCHVMQRNLQTGDLIWGEDLTCSPGVNMLSWQMWDASLRIPFTPRKNTSSQQQVCRVTRQTAVKCLLITGPPPEIRNPPAPFSRIPKSLHLPSCTLSAAPGLRQRPGKRESAEVTRLSLNPAGMRGFDWVL